MIIVFFGSSAFSMAALKTCLESRHSIPLVMTTPDQKKGRGLKLTPTVVRQFCHDRQICAEAAPDLKDAALMERVQSLKPDLFVVSSYGKLIPSAWLKIPSRLCLNVHPSLLPKYRGAAPLHWPIINGDPETGISIAEVTSKLDSGDIFYQEKFALDARMDSEKLEHALAELSQKALHTVLQRIEQNTLTRVPQDESASSYARKLSKEDGKLSLKEPAVKLDRLVRGLKPWPGSFLDLQGNHLLILDAEPGFENTREKPGTLLALHSDGAVSIATGEGILKLKRVRPAGKKEMSAADFANGHRLKPGVLLS
ncbi:MAG TPA: methionyl-tRNA formyltransferase [bacterium]|nr:methionyl-tRNA formyltransferase [bacterium]